VSRREPRLSTPALFDLEDPAAGEGSFVRVALNRPVDREFTYRVAPELAERAVEGARVAVPFGPTRQVGVVVGTDRSTELSERRLRSVLDVLDDSPIVGEGLLGLTRWMAERYACAWGEALAAVLPAPLKHERSARKILVVEAAPGIGQGELQELEKPFPKQFRLLRTLLDIEGEIELRDLLRSLNLSESPARSLERRGWVRIRRVEPRLFADPCDGMRRTRPRELTPEQTIAVRRIEERLRAREHGAFLLQGVTGSGKTEVYLRAIEAARALERSAIVLVPEIALTPQTVGWFRSRFGDVAVLHSRLTDAQRLEMWNRLRSGRTGVVVGARSAVFAPVRDLGVVVVDEEHEPSFKQANTPRYHARDVAVERARREGAVCILGSATPSLESWRGAQEGRLERLSLPRRVGGGSLPTANVVDMRLEASPKNGGPLLFSRLLRAFLAETLEAGEQAILFQNRRGFVPTLWCPGCGTTVRCGQCDLGMTFHRRIRRLVCHSCCEERELPAACPTCSRPGLRPLGVGSERVEAELARAFPEARIRRMDSDTMRRREDYETTLDAFGRREIDVLVGTQMIAKGLDFPSVTLVGIVSADQALHLPDFRASERTFQLIAQVAGRAGRGEAPGRIVVQTSAPEHPAIRHALSHDFESFVREEDALRQELGYPPHGRLVRAVFEDSDEAKAARAAEHYAGALRGGLEGSASVVLGSAPAPVSFLRGRHRHHLVVKSPLGDAGFERAVRLLAEGGEDPLPKIDVDPVSML